MGLCLILETEKNYKSQYYSIYVWALSFDQLKRGCEIITPLNFINSLNHGCVWGNSPYEKLWDHLDNRENRDLRSTKLKKPWHFSYKIIFDIWQSDKSFDFKKPFEFQTLNCPFFRSFRVHFTKFVLFLPDLLISLRTLEICAPCFPENLLNRLETGLASLSDLLCHNCASIRHISSRCLASLAALKSLRNSVIILAVEKVRNVRYSYCNTIIQCNIELYVFM